MKYLPKSRKKSKIRSKSKEKWIQKAKLKKGTMRAYVKEKYGKEGFTEKNTIKVSVLKEITDDPNVHIRTRRRAQLALNLKQIKR